MRPYRLFFFFCFSPFCLSFPPLLQLLPCVVGPHLVVSSQLSASALSLSSRRSEQAGHDIDDEDEDDEDVWFPVFVLLIAWFSFVFS